MKACLDLAELEVMRIDQKVLINPGNDAGYDQQQGSAAGLPLVAVGSARGRRSVHPMRKARRIEDFVRHAVGYGDFDVMLVRRGAATSRHPIPDPCRRSTLACVNPRTPP